MSASKQATLRTQSSVELAEKYNAQAQQLQEMFPAFSFDDLYSLLAETNGDVQLAVTRISDGRVEQWGPVTRKKDKKAAVNNQAQSKDSFSGRGDSRGGRGGRGGRGSLGRGSAPARSRGSSRGGHSGANGHTSRPNSNAGWADSTAGADGIADKPTQESTDFSEGGLESKSDAVPPPSSHWADISPAESNSAGWNTFSPTAPIWGGDSNNNGSAVTSSKLPVSQPKAFKTPATSKMSWAQVARLQEKPSSPLPAAVNPLPANVSSTQSNAPHEPAPPIETQHEADGKDGGLQGWEEPTTVQSPAWDDEPQVKPPSTGLDSWPPASETADEPKSDLADAQTRELVSQQIPSSLPTQLNSQPQETEPSHTVSPPSKPITPPMQQRPAASTHRSSARYKTTDQPVVMPMSFGQNVEKVGMQFGSLSLGGDVLDSFPAEPVIEEVTPNPDPSKAETVSAPHPASARSQQVHETPAPVAPTRQATHSTASSLFQTSIPSQTQHHTPPQQVSQTQNSLPTHSPQAPHIPSQATSHQVTSQTQQFPPQSVSQQQPLITHPIQQLPPQQLTPSQSQVPSHQQYAQHGLPTHIEPTASQSPHVAPTSQPQQPTATHSSYFRQTESPYFHTPTPPAGQAQEAPYGTFGQLGQQAQHQGQPSHPAGFGAGDYGYGDSQRGFYEPYAQQSGFGNRNVIGHEDVKGLQAPQQPHVAAALQPSNPSAAQQHPPAPSSQGNGQPQAASGQGPQQGYPPPVPYYYNPYPQNQYYGGPYNSAYGVPQPFVKYPAMFQPGPPGPGTAPSPAAKQPATVQPQTGPYAQGLYGQQHPSTSYDDIGYQHHNQQHQQHGLTHGQGVAANLPTAEYAKQHTQLYGGHSTQGMQSFMGLGQGTGPSSGPPLGQRAAGSPETAYKPYAPNVGVKDVGAGVGVGQTGVGQVPQGRGGVPQQPQHNQGAFYGGNRFGSSAGTGPQGQQAQPHHQAQGQGPQGHLGYPQGGNDGNFYSYQPRQQAYWQ